MSDAENIQSTPLQLAFRAARRVAGKGAVHTTLRSLGAASGVLEDVPLSKQVQALAALRKLSDGDDTVSDADALADMRRKAYGDTATPSIPRNFEELAAQAYKKWNEKKPKPTPEGK